MWRQLWTHKNEGVLGRGDRLGGGRCGGGSGRGGIDGTGDVECSEREGCDDSVVTSGGYGINERGRGRGENDC